MKSALLNRRIVVTRAQDDAVVMCELLRAQGAIPVEVPTIEILEYPSPDELPPPLAGLTSEDWLVFTSPNAVGVFFSWKIVTKGLMLPCRIASVGGTTAKAIERYGFRAAFVPTTYTSQFLAEELPGVAQKRVIWVGPRVRNEHLEMILKRRGAEVEFIAAYETRRRPITDDGRHELKQGVDAITFASPSAVDGLMSQLDDRSLEFLSAAPVACIGPVTAAAARRSGLMVVAMPQAHDVVSLVDALAEYFSKHSLESLS